MQINYVITFKLKKGVCRKMQARLKRIDRSFDYQRLTDSFMFSTVQFDPVTLNKKHSCSCPLLPTTSNKNPSRKRDESEFQHTFIKLV